MVDTRVYDMAGIRVWVERYLDHEYFTEQERRVLKLRFGIEDEQYHTQEYTAERIGVTRARIKDIENKCMRKLSGYKMSKREFNLENYLVGPKTSK